MLSPGCVARRALVIVFDAENYSRNRPRPAPACCNVQTSTSNTHGTMTGNTQQALEQGFILTRHWRDTPSGTEIDFWLATDAGPRKVRLTAQTSVAFAEASLREALVAQIGSDAGIALRELPLKTFQQQPVLGVYASRYKQLTALERALREHGIKLYEADIR